MFTRSIVFLIFLAIALSQFCKHSPYFPPQYRPFSLNFTVPPTPLLPTNYIANFLQHKWNGEGITNHITYGVVYAALSKNKFVSHNFYDGINQTSWFDLASYNPNEPGTIYNVVYQIDSTTGKEISCLGYWVVPALTVVPADFLIVMNATYTGPLYDDYHGECMSWGVQGPSKVAITGYFAPGPDDELSLARIDFFTPNQKTYTTTRYLTINVQTVPDEFLVKPCEPS
eukprot:TRINITY_DN6754_c0_g1_i1.p1 TRINITY_DN6754_c0_g1~~TRINITY_DN6754_c0_g1_i1.p1  ORF type:complete len:228 (+),score=24.00 TRINITY_DN6754_c0_g1_i1:66-749(+)